MHFDLFFLLFVDCMNFIELKGQNHVIVNKPVISTLRKKMAYEEPFKVLQQNTYMEPLKVLQRTPSQGFFEEPLPMVLQRTP